VQIKPTPEANLEYACALSGRAASSKDPGSAKIDYSRAEMAAKAALRGSTPPLPGTYDTLAGILEDEGKFAESGR